MKETHKSPPKHKPGGYYFLYWFRCPKCKAFFMVEPAKRYFDTDPFPNVQAPLFCALDTAAEVPALPNKAEEISAVPNKLVDAKTVSIYTDGACVGNPGPGGWAAVLIYGEHRREIVGADAATTNNRMEIMAAISALESLKESCNVKLHSDSRYVIDGITKWIHGWKRRNWTRNGWKAKGENKTCLVINADLWQRLDAARARHDVEWIWVKGHAGTSENERCDVLAEAAARRSSSGKIRGQTERCQ